MPALDSTSRSRRTGKAKQKMQANDWAPEHCQALKDYLALGMSFAEIARAINASFGTAYSRNATIGRSKRMKLTALKRPATPRKARPHAKADMPPRSSEKRDTAPVRPPWPATSGPPATPSEAVKLRCVGISPRLVSLIELDASDCRYPYGGDRENEPITFCGHPRLPGSSYCAPHSRLSRGPGTEVERAAASLVLRLVQAA
jgi:GcrA cell cycle regulator